MQINEATLSVMAPVTMTDAVLTSTTVNEDDHAEYSAAKADYALGDRVISLTSHRIYERATATATAGKDPTDINNRIADAAGVIWWIDVSATNAWKMFDDQTSSRTISTSPLTLVIEPGFISSLYVGGLVNVDQAVVTMKDAPGGTEKYAATVDLENSQPDDYWDYGYLPFSQKPNFILNDIPPYFNSELTIVFTTSSGNMEIGMVAVGDLRHLGQTQYGGTATPKTYSRITIDEFGENEIVRRKSANDLKLRTHIKKNYSDTAHSILTSILDVPVVVVATTQSELSALRTFGLVTGEMNYDNPDDFFIDITVRGLI